MAALFVYVCFILKLTLVARQAVAVHYVLKGKEAILSPALPKAPDDILWKHNGDKVVTFDSAEEHVFPPFDGRVTLGWGTAELTIADVGYEDSGEYELEAFIRDKLHRSQYILKVLDKVSKPVIRCEINDESGNSTSVRRATLLCSSDSNTPEALTFKWTLEGKSQPGQTLTIALGDEYDHIEYSCTATNPKHAETGIYMAKDCYTGGNSKALDIIVPIVIASLILLAFCIFPFIFRHQIKRACLKEGKNDDLEKQITVADGNNKDEGSPLMGDIHRQETFASKQPLIQQNVMASPQSQEIGTELEEPRPSRKVKKRSKRFSNREHVESQTEEENDTDTVETATSQPASPIRNGQVDSEGESHYNAEGRHADSDHSSQYHDALEQTERQVSGEHESREKTDSEGETDVHHSDHAPKTNVSEDSSSVHSGQEEATKAPEQAELLSYPHLQSSAPQEHKDLQLTKTGLAEFNEKIRPEPIVDQESQQDPEDESKPVFIQPEQTKPVSLPQLAHQSNVPVFDVDSQSEPVEPESKEQVSPDEESSPALVDEDPQGNDSHNESVTSEHKEAEESELSDDSQRPPAHSELSESTPPSQHSPPAHKRQIEDEKTDLDEESNTVDKEKQRGSSSSDSLASEPNTAESGELGLTNGRQSHSGTESSESLPQSPLQHRPASVHGSQSESDEPEDKEKTSPVEQTKPDPVDKDSQEDSDHESVRSDNEAERAKDAALNDTQPSPPESESSVDDASSQTDQNQNHHLGPNAEMVKELKSSTDSSSKESEESKQTSTTELTPSADSELPELQSQSPSSDPQSRAQTDSEGEPDMHHSDHEHVPKTDAAGDSSSINSGQEETTKAPEQAESPPQSPLQHRPASVHGSQSDEPEDKEKTSPVEQTKPDPVDKDPQEDSEHESVRSDNEAEIAEDSAINDTQPSPPESDSPGSEKESDESTHPTASALSQRAHNKETKDTDAENASSAQVSEETKDNTDKESDSSGSEQINEANKLKEGQQ